MLHFDVKEERFTREVLEGVSEEVVSRDAGEESRMFANRLGKNLKTLGKWAASNNISCYRLYDADIPEFNLAVDLYDGHVHVQEYEAPYGVDPRRAAARLESAIIRVQEEYGPISKKMRTPSR